MKREKNRKKDVPLTIFKMVYIGVIVLLVAAVMWPAPQQSGEDQTTADVVEVKEEPASSEQKEEPAKVETKQEKKTTTTTTKKKTTAKKETTKKSTTTTTKKSSTTTKSNTNYRNGFVGFITHYGPDCKGCSGTTASGYNVKNTMYYNDKDYGQIRIVATSKNIPLYTVIRISNYKKGSMIAIVLDRGVSGNKIDVLVESEKAATQLGIQKNANVEILRWGK